jgi:hypothetical protein
LTKEVIKDENIEIVVSLWDENDDYIIGTSDENKERKFDDGAHGSHEYNDGYYKFDFW